MDNKNKSYIVFISIVIAVIIITALAFITLNEPKVIPAVLTTADNDSSAVDSAIENNPEVNTENTDTETSELKFPLDLNTATKSDLMQLDGIGEVIAERIIEYRAAGNYFYSVDEIKNVKGIGDSVYIKIIDSICVNTDILPTQTIQNTSIIFTNAESLDSAAITQSALVTDLTTEALTTVSITTTTINFPIDINSATAEELMCLNGIGETLANRIIDYRKNNNGFYSIDEIMEVNGIGKNTFDKIKWQIWADTSQLPDKTTTTTTVKETTTTAEAETTTQEIQTLNINTASAEDFMTLPKIDYELAENIVNLRDNVIGGSFTSIYEILYADGMTNSIFNGIKPYIFI